MKKISFTFLFVVLLVGNLLASTQKWVGINNSSPSKPVVTLVSGTDNHSVIKVSLNGYFTENVSTPKGEAVTISVPGTSTMLEKGNPELPYVTTSLIIPDRANMVVNVLSSKFTDYENIEVAPSKGSFTRDILPSTVPYTYSNQYQVNEFFPALQTEMYDPFILRDLRGQSVVIKPFTYNPVTKTLRVYHEMVVEVKAEGVNMKNAREAANVEKIDGEFYNIYQDQFLNFANVAKYTPIVEYGKMLVVSHPDFMEAMQPFVNWKNSIGIETEMVSSAEVGTTAAQIKTYVQNYYNTNGLTFLLLVGDSQHLPPLIGGGLGGHSDIAFAYVTGNDRYPEFLVGRFSVETAQHAQTMVDRTIQYEKTPNAGNDWFKKGIGIASQEGPGDNNEYDYQHLRVIRNKLLGYTYTSVAELYEGSQGGEDASGHPSAAMVVSNVNTGASVINYIGHGSSNAWSTSGFSNNHITSLTNNEKWPFIWSVACVNGEFVGKTCFAEAWTRASNNNGPTGAIATYMSTINQPWVQPMRAQDEMNDLLVEAQQNNIKRTYAGISYSGSMKMIDGYGAGGNATADTWVIFGDPSVMVRTDVPTQLQANHPEVLFLGSSEPFNVTTDNGARATLSKNGEILATSLVENGTATLNFDPIVAPEPIVLTVTAYNKIPYIVELTPIPADGPYVVVPGDGGVELAGDGVLSYGETTGLTLKLKNIGAQTTNGNVSVTISSENPKVTIGTATASVNAIAAGQTANATGFNITVNNAVENDEKITFKYVATDGAKATWEGTFILTAKKPIVEYVSHSWAGSFDANSEQEITVNFKNNGGFQIANASVALTTTVSNVTITNVSNTLGTVAPGETKPVKFKVAFGNVATDQPVPFKATVTGDQGAYTSDAEFVLANECDIIFNLKDGYGDGWNGATLTVSFNNGASPVTMSVPSGSASHDQTLTVASGAEVTLTWKKGSYDAEVSFEVKNAAGEILYQHAANTAINNGVLTTFTNNCGAEATVECEAVTNVAANVSEDGNDVTLTWNKVSADQGGGDGSTHTMTYSGPFADNSVGMNGQADFDVAHKFPASELTNYVGWKISKIAFVPAEANCTYSLRAWTGANGDNMILDQEIPNVNISAENIVDVTGNATIVAGQDLWVGYRCNALAGFPAGVDAGPAVDGKGNMIKLDGVWDSLSNLASTLNYNWCIVTTITNAKGESVNITIEDAQNRVSSNNALVAQEIAPVAMTMPARSTFTGYKVYRDNEFLADVPAGTTTYLDENVISGLYTYCVTAVYADPACESEKVCTSITGINDVEGVAGLRVYPNPATDILNVQGENIKDVIMYNSLGQAVKVGMMNNQINVSTLSNGIYYLVITTNDSKRAVEKIVINK